MCETCACKIEDFILFTSKCAKHALINLGLSYYLLICINHSISRSLRYNLMTNYSRYLRVMNKNWQKLHGPSLPTWCHLIFFLKLIIMMLLIVDDVFLKNKETRCKDFLICCLHVKWAI